MERASPTGGMWGAPPITWATERVATSSACCVQMLLYLLLHTINPISKPLWNCFQRKSKPANTRFMKNYQSILSHNTQYPFYACFLLKLTGKKKKIKKTIQRSYLCSCHSQPYNYWTYNPFLWWWNYNASLQLKKDWDMKLLIFQSLDYLSHLI